MSPGDSRLSYLRTKRLHITISYTSYIQHFTLPRRRYPRILMSYSSVFPRCRPRFNVLSRNASYASSGPLMTLRATIREAQTTCCSEFQWNTGFINTNTAVVRSCQTPPGGSRTRRARCWKIYVLSLKLRSYQSVCSMLTR